MLFHFTVASSFFTILELTHYSHLKTPQVSLFLFSLRLRHL